MFSLILQTWNKFLSYSYKNSKSTFEILMWIERFEKIELNYEKIEYNYIWVRKYCNVQRNSYSTRLKVCHISVLVSHRKGTSISFGNISELTTITKGEWPYILLQIKIFIFYFFNRNLKEINGCICINLKFPWSNFFSLYFCYLPIIDFRKYAFASINILCKLERYYKLLITSNICVELYYLWLKSILFLKLWNFSQIETERQTTRL